MFGNGMLSSTEYGSTAFCTVFINHNVANDKQLCTFLLSHIQDNKQYCTSIEAFVTVHKHAGHNIAFKYFPCKIKTRQDSDF